MKLEILSTSPAWYSQGLKFQCTQCGNCCTGGPGFVWINKEEITRLAALLNLSEEETQSRYCRDLNGQTSLQEVRNSNGLYDCVFLKDQRGGKRTCSVYHARPAQCRQWPFWPGNLADREAWDRAGARCPGINQGRLHSSEEIEAARQEPTH